MATSRFELPVDGVLAAGVCLEQRMPAGDPVRLRSAARRCGAWATDLRRAASTLLSGAETPLWRGAAHRAFVDQIRTQAPSMTATADRYDHYAAALTTYAGALGETAPRLVAGRRLLQQRCAELARARQAQGPGAVEPAASDPGTDLLPIARDFKAGYDRWADALDRCIRALSQADEVDPSRDTHGLSALRHGLSAVGHDVAHVAGAAVSPFERALLHPSLHNISHCLGSLNTDLTVLGLGLLFLCPPAAAACLTAATVLAVVQVAVDSTRRARGEHVSNASLGLEMAAAIPLGGNAVRGLRATGDVTHLVPGGGLLAHEGIENGHTLVKHVGKTEAFLRNRLATEPELKAASTFHDRASAEISLSELIDAKAENIERWLRSNDDDLVLSGRAARPVGFVITRALTRPVESTGIRLVLRRSSAINGLDFRIHTAMVTP